MEKYAYLNSPIHGLATSGKLMTLLGLLILTLIVTPFLPPIQSAQLMIALAAILAIITWASRVPLRFLLLRSCLILPFTAFVILVNTLAGSMHPVQILHLLMRSTLSVFSILLLITTTPFHKILAQMSHWHFPRLLVMVISFMYRYFFVLASEISALEKGIAMRHSDVKGRKRINTYANMLGMLLIRSYERAENVHRAMEMRGYSEETG